LLLAIACGEPATNDPPAPVAAAAPETAEQFRVRHERDYRRDWVTISGLFPLKAGANTAGSAPSNDIVLPSVPARLGQFVLDGTAVRFEPAAGATVRLGDVPVTASVPLVDDGQREAKELVSGDVRMIVHLSGTTPMLRVRDPNGPLAKDFLGFSWFDLDPAYRVTGRFIPDAQPRKQAVANTFGDVDEYTTEGVVEFALAGQTLRLRPFTTRPGRLYFVFKDASSGAETYEAARFLYADLLEDGTAVLDFNIAYNPPCAFNPYTTCPIPLPENRLPVKVLAGEKAYPVKVHLPEASKRRG
jgi:uncharacterized protein (DUF1684 family)